MIDIKPLEVSRFSSDKHSFAFYEQYVSVVINYVGKKGFRADYSFILFISHRKRTFNFFLRFEDLDIIASITRKLSAI